MKVRALYGMPAAIALLTASALLLTPALLQAGPVFAIPTGGAPAPLHLPGFVVHMGPIGPVPLTPGIPVGTVYTDFMPNPADPHHWEIELNNSNPGPAPTAFDVEIKSPGGGVFLGSVTLSPGWSAYWDVHYADVPEVGGLWTFLATNPAGGVPGILIDSSVIEYNQPLLGIGPSGPWFAGPAGPGAGGFIGPLLGISLMTVSVVPEPSTLTLLGVGVLGLLVWRKRSIS